MNKIERIARSVMMAMSQQYVADTEGHVYTDFSGIVEYGENTGKVSHATVKLENGTVFYHICENGEILRKEGNWQEDVSLSGNYGKKFEMSDVGYGRWGHLHRIRALRDIGVDVKAGSLGGYIESESNLSQDGDCWIYGIASVSGTSVISGDVRVLGTSKVKDSTLSGNGAVIDSELENVNGDGTLIVVKSAMKNANSNGLVRIDDGCYVCGGEFADSVEVLHCSISGNVTVKGSAKLSNCEIATKGESTIEISGNAKVRNSYIGARNVVITGNAVVDYDVTTDGIVIDGTEFKEN